jgi:hypothetical protein
MWFLDDGRNKWAGELVIFLPEPENLYDVRAVAIKRLKDGAHLGYLLRADQHINTKGQVQFGRICETGAFTTGGGENHYAKVPYTAYTVYKTLCPNDDTWKDESQPQKQGEG